MKFFVAKHAILQGRGISLQRLNLAHNAHFKYRDVFCDKINSFRFNANIQKLSAHFTNICFAVICKVWVIFGKFWEEIVFIKGFVKFGEIKNIEDLIC